MRVCYYTINNSLDDNGCTHFILRNETSTLLSKAQILYMLSVTEICSLFCIKRYNIHVQSPGKHLILYSKLSYSEVQEILCWKCHFAPNLKLSSLFSNINAIVNLFFFLIKLHRNSIFNSAIYIFIWIHQKHLMEWLHLAYSAKYTFFFGQFSQRRNIS